MNWTNNELKIINDYMRDFWDMEEESTTPHPSPITFGELQLYKKADGQYQVQKSIDGDLSLSGELKRCMDYIIKKGV